jgi:molecular chaperone GrpE (heat shock protein)
MTETFLASVEPKQLRGFTQQEEQEEPILVVTRYLASQYESAFSASLELKGKLRSKEETESEYAGFLLRVLEVVDFWERILASTADDEAPAVKRLRGGYELLLEELSRVGVRPYETCVGDRSTPKKHRVIGTEENETLPDGVICQVVKTGYMRNDRILRQAYVFTVRNEGGV